MTPARRLLAVLLASSIVSALVLGGAASGAERHATAKPTWQDFRGFAIDQSSPVLGAGWAAGRVWFTGRYGNDMRVGSAHISGDKLSSFVGTKVADSGHRYSMFLGNDELAFYVGATQDSFLTAPLLPSGLLGGSKPVPDDFLATAKQRIPNACTTVVDDGTRVGGRVFWAIGGAALTPCAGAGKPFLLVCCATDGFASERILPINEARGSRGAIGVDISSDARGRIWLLWLDNTRYTGANRGIARLVEVDPATMALRTKPYAVPGGLVDNLKLACASTCRAVVQTAGGNLATWAPGEGKATTLVRKVEIVSSEEDRPQLLDASFVAGRLVVAYHAFVGKRSDPRDTLLVARGDARGRNARVVRSTEITNWPPGATRNAKCSLPYTYATFVPRGLVALEVYQFTIGVPSGICPVIPVTLLPLTG